VLIIVIRNVKDFEGITKKNVGVIVMNRQILHGDVLKKLAEIPNETFDTIISSPPYWGLRDYGVDGQLGLEPDFRDYLKIMSKIMTELKRVLKSTGTCWINLGDTYASGGEGVEQSFDRNRGVDNQKEQNHTPKSAYRKYMAKSRFGIPERFYINCIDDGWIARNHIPWYKSNSMPSSVKDRFTNKWESIFFFAKSQKYYFNLDAVREKTLTESKPFNIRVRENITGHAQAKLGDKSWTATKDEMERYNKNGTIKEKYKDEPQSNVARLHKEREGNPNKQDTTLGADGKPNPTYKGFNERWNNKAQDQYTKRVLEERENGANHDNPLGNPKGKNPGDVFFINPRPFTEAHFATFPVDLPLKILKCACPPNGIVLDPFFGAGTVGVAAEILGLQWCGIELKEEYIDIARKRLKPYQNNKLEAFL